MADLGGGSLELVRLERGRLAEHATLPLGVLRLGSLKPGRRTALAAERLGASTWLQRLRGEPVYLVGGAWRALARLRMAAEQHPVAVVHHYRMATAEARNVAKEFAAADPSTLRPGPEGMWPRRLATVPSGAAVLIALLEIARPSDVLFSAFGLREGLLFDRLPQAVRARDPLHEAWPGHRPAGRPLPRLCRGARVLAGTGDASGLRCASGRAAGGGLPLRDRLAPASGPPRRRRIHAHLARALRRHRPSGPGVPRVGRRHALQVGPSSRGGSGREQASVQRGAGRGPRARSHAQARRAALLRGAGRARRIRARGSERPPRAAGRARTPCRSYRARPNRRQRALARALGRTLSVETTG